MSPDTYVGGCPPLPRQGERGEIQKNRLSIEAYCERASRDIVVHLDGKRITITEQIPLQARRADLLPAQPQPTEPVFSRDISRDSRTKSRRGSPAA